MHITQLEGMSHSHAKEEPVVALVFDAPKNGEKEETAKEELVKKKEEQAYPLAFGRNTVVKGHPLYEIKRKLHIPRPARGVRQTAPVKLDKDWIILTPINTIAPTTELSVAAKADYILEEKKFFEGSDFPMWDDPDQKRKANAVPGDLFAFVHNQAARGKDLVEIFEVTSKKDVSARPPHWWIPAHQDRAVVVLSRYIAWISFTDLSVAMGRRKSRDEGVNCLRGTERRPWPKFLTVYME